MGSQEKRKFKRMKVSTPAWIFDNNGTFIQGNVDNFSLGGTLVIASASAGKIETGKIFTIKIGCPDDTGNSTIPQTIAGLSEVMRMENHNGGKGIALKFISELIPD